MDVVRVLELVNIVVLWQPWSRLRCGGGGGSGLAAAVGVAIGAYVERHAAVHRALASGRLGVLDHVVALGHQLTLRVSILGGVRVAVVAARRVVPQLVAATKVMDMGLVRFMVQHWTRQVGACGVGARVAGRGTCDMSRGYPGLFRGGA